MFTFYKHVNFNEEFSFPGYGDPKAGGVKHYTKTNHSRGKLIHKGKATFRRFKPTDVVHTKDHSDQLSHWMIAEDK